MQYDKPKKGYIELQSLTWFSRFIVKYDDGTKSTWITEGLPNRKPPRVEFVKYIGAMNNSC